MKLKIKPKNEPSRAAPETPSPLDAAYTWLSAVEDLLRKGFVPDETIISRSRVKIATRSRALKTVSVDEPPKLKGQLNVLSVASSLDSWLARLDAPMSPEDERKAGEQASKGMANRDVLAHRIGRPSGTVRWQGCPTDCYAQGGRAYRRRLAAIGAIISDMGWLPEPESHPWRQKAKEPSRDMRQREADAEANAAAMVR